MNFREYFLREESEVKPWMRSFDWAEDYIRIEDKLMSWNVRPNEQINSYNGVTSRDLLRNYQLLYSQLMSARLITDNPIRLKPDSPYCYCFSDIDIYFYAIYGLPNDKPNNYTRMANLEYATSAYYRAFSKVNLSSHTTVDVYQKDEDGYYHPIDQNELMVKIFGKESDKYFEILRAFSFRDTKRRVEEVMNEYYKNYIAQS